MCNTNTHITTITTTGTAPVLICLISISTTSERKLSNLATRYAENNEAEVKSSAL